MTVKELIRKFNDEFGIDKWPKSYEVDAETYANVCQKLFNYNKSKYNYTMIGLELWSINLIIGPNNGIMFKNVELIYKGRKTDDVT